MCILTKNPTEVFSYGLVLFQVQDHLIHYPACGGWAPDFMLNQSSMRLGGGTTKSEAQYLANHAANSKSHLVVCYDVNANYKEGWSNDTNRRRESV